MTEDNCNDFASKCEGKTFASIEELNKFIFDLELSINTAYKIKDSSYFRKRTIEHTRLFFKHVRYVCSGSSNSGCISYILIRAMDNELMVVRYNMRHSHVLPNNSGSLQSKNQLLKIVERLENPLKFTEEEQKPVSSKPFDSTAFDFTETFRNIFDRGSINCLDDLYTRIDEFKFSTGSIYSVTRSGKFPQGTLECLNFVYKTLNFQCKHSGLVKNTYSRSRSSKMNCPSKINFKFSDGRFVVGHFNVTHNHAVSQDYAKYYQENKRLSKEQKVEAELIIERNLNNQTIQEYIEKKFGRKFFLEEVRRMKYLYKRKEIASTPHKQLVSAPDNIKLEIFSEDNMLHTVAVPITANSQLQNTFNENRESIYPCSEVIIDERRHNMLPILQRLEHALKSSDIRTFHSMLGDLLDVLVKYQKFPVIAPAYQHCQFSSSETQISQPNFQDDFFHRN